MAKEFLRMGEAYGESFFPSYARVGVGFGRGG